MVTGTNTCPGLNPNWTPDPGGTWQVRDLTVECTDKTDDPRVSGTHTATWGMDVWGALDQGIGAGVQWGTVRLENAGGAWEGRLAGVASLPGRGDIITIWYRGTGGYAGLAYFELVTGSPPTWKIQGQVFPGDPPPPYAEGGTTIVRPEASGPVADDAVAVVTGTADCPGLDFDFTADPDGTWHVRDDYHADRCTLDDRRPARHRRPLLHLELRPVGEPERRHRCGRPVGHPAPRERRGSLGGPRHGRRVPARTRRHHRELVQGDRRVRGAGLLRAVDRKRSWKIQGQIFPGDPPTP